MADEEQKRGPGRPRKDESQPGFPKTPEAIDERVTTDKPTDGRPQEVGYVDPEIPNHPDFHDNPLVEIRRSFDDVPGTPGPRPKGTTEVEILRRYVPEVVVNDAGNAVATDDGSFRPIDNARGGEPLAKGRIVRLPSKEAARLIRAGIATTTDNTFDAAD